MKSKEPKLNLILEETAMIQHLQFGFCIMEGDKTSNETLIYILYIFSEVVSMIENKTDALEKEKYTNK